MTLKKARQIAAQCWGKMMTNRLNKDAILIEEFVITLREQIDEAVAAERERCTKWIEKIKVSQCDTHNAGVDAVLQKIKDGDQCST